MTAFDSRVRQELAKVDPPLDPDNTLVEQVAELRERLNVFRRCLGILAGIARWDQMERYRRRLREEGIVPTNGGSDEGRS